jgi:hypothetical protein
MSLGLLGKLKQKKLAAQTHLAVDSTLGIAHSANDAADNKTTPGEKGGASAWGALKGNLREAQGKGPKGPDIGDIVMAAAGVNLADMKRQMKEHQQDKEKHTSLAMGYELATSTVSVRLRQTPFERTRLRCLYSVI